MHLPFVIPENFNPGSSRCGYHEKSPVFNEEDIMGLSIKGTVAK